MAELETKPLRSHDVVRMPHTIESLAWECEQDRLHTVRRKWTREERLERAAWMAFGILIFVAGMVAGAMVR